MARQSKNLDRLFKYPSSQASQFNTSQLIMTCNSVCHGRFFAKCFHHPDGARLCHQYRVVYTDGACTNNGTLAAICGIGIAFGTADDGRYQFSIPVDDDVDPGGKRTNQRAELLAALEGLKKIANHDQSFFAHKSRTRREGEHKPQIVITTDSEYVVKGMTEWFPVWKANGMRKPNGQRPWNLDLFLKLDAEVAKRESDHDCEVKFWRIERGYNTIADEHAKRAVRDAAAHVGHQNSEYALTAS